MPLIIHPGVTRPRPAPSKYRTREVTRTDAVMVQGMHGLGDNIFQRPFVAALANRAHVFLSTPWPEIYEGMANVQFVHVPTPLRTQARNIKRQTAGRWAARPMNVRTMVVRYGSASLLGKGTIIRSMEQCFGVAPLAWDLPAFPRMVRDRPIAVVRPVTVRTEWHNTARAPLPEYVTAVAADLMRDHHVISVADLAPGVEWMLGDAPPAHEHFHNGELGVRELLGLIQSAAVVVGGVGWIVPAAIAAGTPLFCILGGHGGHNAPEKITDKRMRLDHVRFATPDAFCRCDSMRHECNKRNTQLEKQWAAFRTECGV